MSRVWYRSLYWRIALGFILCVALLLVAQALLFLWLTNREGAPFASGSPQQVAGVVASELSAALDANRQLDIERYLRDQFRSAYPVVVVFADGRVFHTGPRGAPEGLVQFARRRLARTSDVERAGLRPRWPEAETDRGGRSRRVAMAAIVQDERTTGLVVTVPAGPPFVVALRNHAQRMAWVGLALLGLGTAAMSFFVFTPARRRLLALERSAEALGRGDTGIRAPEHGGDEVAALARAFNRMAADLERRVRELEESDRSRRQLLADVSHELMTPLTAMRGYLETLADPRAIQKPEDRDRYLRIVTEETERLESIVGDLLDLARIEGGGAPFARGRVAVSSLFARAADRHEAATLDKNIAIDTRIEPDAAAVIGDERRLEQVVQNLVANAVRHTPAGGRITLSAERVGSQVRLRVADTGPGIPADHLPRVFDRFYRVDAARDQASGGTGLGLSIVKAIVERSGGSIQAWSEWGRGAAFDVLLEPA
jgi:two-component system, OmpR family, sensor kinase